MTQKSGHRLFSRRRPPAGQTDHILQTITGEVSRYHRHVATAIRGPPIRQLPYISARPLLFSLGRVQARAGCKAPKGLRPAVYPVPFGFVNGIVVAGRRSAQVRYGTKIPKEKNDETTTTGPAALPDGGFRNVLPARGRCGHR